MKRVLIVVILVVGASALGLWRSHGGVRAGFSKAVGMSDAESQGEARDEVRKSFVLQPGARLEVEGINGKPSNGTPVSFDREAIARHAITVDADHACVNAVP